MPELRFVLDTNVVVSAALLKRSVSQQAFDLASSLGTILLSWPLIAELNDVMSRPKFDRYLTERERMLFVALLVRDATMVDIIEKVTVSRDPKDDKMLEVALSGRATCIVSGDKDLLVLSIRTQTDELVGFCCFGLDTQVPGGDYSFDALDIGLGIRPDLTGQGRGVGYVLFVLGCAAHMFKPSYFRVTIAEFNKRALQVW